MLRVVQLHHTVNGVHSVPAARQMLALHLIQYGIHRNARAHLFAILLPGI